MNKTIGVIGLGNMAKAIIGGLLDKGFVAKEQIVGSDKFDVAVNTAKETFGITAGTDNVEVVKKADILLLAVKPQMISGILDEIKEDIKDDTLVISIIAGKTVAYLQNGFGKNVKIARCMPNTPALVGAGCTGVCCSKEVSEGEKEEVLHLLESIGIVKEVPENLMDAIVGASGSSPAFVFMMIEAMADAVVQAGMPRDMAYDMVAQAIYGSAKLYLESEKVLGKKMHPGQLKDMVCSPAGTTIDGVMALEKGGFRGTLMDAVAATIERSKQL